MNQTEIDYIREQAIRLNALRFQLDNSSALTTSTKNDLAEICGKIFSEIDAVENKLKKHPKMGVCPRCENSSNYIRWIDNQKTEVHCRMCGLFYKEGK